MEKHYSISRSRPISFLAVYHELRALEEWGVDNWSGYGENFRDYTVEGLDLPLEEYESANEYTFEDLAEYIVDREYMPI